MSDPIVTSSAPVAEVFLRDHDGTFFAERFERADGLVTATGRWRYRCCPADRWGPRVTRSWPVRELREVRHAETAASA